MELLMPEIFMKACETYEPRKIRPTCANRIGMDHSTDMDAKGTHCLQGAAECPVANFKPLVCLYRV